MPKRAPKGKYAWSVKVGEKGQIVIPKEARDMFGFEPGDTLLLMGDRKRGMIIPPQAMVDRIGQLIFEEGTMREEDDDDTAESDEFNEGIPRIPTGEDQF